MASSEAKLIKVVQTGIDDGNAVDNDLRRGRVMKQRDKAICKLHVVRVQNWTGTIDTLDSNGDGDGVLTVEIAAGVKLGTWNNALSDYEDHTLIKSEKLMDKLAEMSEGDKVTFSGTFITADDSCIANKGLTKVGKLLDPEFVFRFSDVKAA